MWWRKKKREIREETLIDWAQFNREIWADNPLKDFKDFDPEKAQYLKDNNYHALDWKTTQEYLEKCPWLDTLWLEEKGFKFYKRYYGDIALYSEKYLKEKTLDEIRKGSSSMAWSFRPEVKVNDMRGDEDTEHKTTTSDM